MGGESANILAPWYNFHHFFLFLEEPLNNFSESFVVLFQQWTDAFPLCFVLLPHLLELSVFRPDDLLENRQCGETGERRGVCAQFAGLQMRQNTAIAWQDGSILEIICTHACARSHMRTYMHPRSCLWSHTHAWQIGREIWGKQHGRMCRLCLRAEHLQMRQMHSRWYVQCQLQRCTGFLQIMLCLCENRNVVGRIRGHVCSLSKVIGKQTLPLRLMCNSFSTATSLS